MDAGLGFLDEVEHNLSVVVVLVGRAVFVGIFHLVDNVCDFLCLAVEVRDFTTVKDVVDVFNESLLSDLGIREEEHSLLLIDSCSHE